MKMMKKRKQNKHLVLTSTFIAMPLTILFSQTVIELSLVKALEEGLSNRPELKIQSIDQQIADQANAKIKAFRLPQLESSADFRLNTQLQSTVLPFDITGQNPEGTSTVRFGTRFQNTIGFGLNQIISDPTKKIEWEINLNRMQIQQQLSKEITINLQLTIYQAYYAAVYYQEKLEIAEQDLDRAQLNRETSQSQWQQGVLLENEWLRLQVAATNAELEMEKAKDQYRLSLLQLTNEIYLDPETTVSLTDNLETLEAGIQLQTSPIALQRPEIERLKLEEKEAAMQAQLILARNKLALNAYANYGILHLNDQFNPLASNTWFPYNYLGLKVTLPIYDGHLAQLDAQEQLLLQKKKNLFLQQTQYRMAQDEAQARVQVDIALKVVSLAKENVILAQKVYTSDQFRFQKGILLPIQLRDSEFDLQNAQSRYLDAVYQLLAADLELKRAIGVPQK